MKNAKIRFKLQFLPSYAAKSRFQRLRECGNGRGTRWNREIREEWCLHRSIWIDFNSDAYKRWRTSLYIGLLIVTVWSKRSTVTINGPRWTVFGNVASVGSEMEGPDSSRDMRYKNAPILLLGSRSDGRDSPRHSLIATVIMPLIKARALNLDWWSALHAIDAWISKRRRSDASRAATSPASDKSRVD